MGYDTNTHVELLRPEWGAPAEWTPAQAAEAGRIADVMAASEWAPDYPELLAGEWCNTRGIAYYDGLGGFVELSRHFPSWVIQIDGEGEEQGDEWRAYVHMGRSVIHSAPDWTPPAFNMDDLRPTPCECGRGPILAGNGTPDCCAACYAEELAR